MFCCWCDAVVADYDDRETQFISDSECEPYVNN